MIRQLQAALLILLLVALGLRLATELLAPVWPLLLIMLAILWIFSLATRR